MARSHSGLNVPAREKTSRRTIAEEKQTKFWTNISGRTRPDGIAACGFAAIGRLASSISERREKKKPRGLSAPRPRRCGGEVGPRLRSSRFDPGEGALCGCECFSPSPGSKLHSQLRSDLSPARPGER